MKTGTALLAISAGAFLVYNSKRTVDSLKFMDVTVGKIKPNLSNILSPGATITVNVFNPNAVPVVISSIYGQVMQDGNRLASYNTTAPIRLDRGTSTSVTVQLRLNALNLINMLKNAALYKVRYELLLEGIIRTAFFDQPIKRTIQL